MKKFGIIILFLNFIILLAGCLDKKSMVANESITEKSIINNKSMPTNEECGECIYVPQFIDGEIGDTFIDGGDMKEADYFNREYGISFILGNEWIGGLVREWNDIKQFSINDNNYDVHNIQLFVKDDSGTNGLREILTINIVNSGQDRKQGDILGNNNKYSFYAKKSDEEIYPKFLRIFDVKDY